MFHRSVLVSFVLLVSLGADAQCDLRMPPTPPGPYLPGAPRGGGPLLVPTVIHVHYGGLLLPISPMHLETWIEETNLDLRAMNADIDEVIPEFASIIGDMGLELRLATRDEQGNCISGIQYHQYDPFTGGPDHLGTTLNTRSYLNIHIGANGSFATLPGSVNDPYDPSDVVMIALYQAVPESRTLAHEIGHWCGLLHTFGFNQTGSCASDDYIDDTPTTAGSQLDCILDQNECTPGVIENVQNHMDYSNCRIMFTEGQAAYAQALLADVTRVRASVVDAANLVTTGVVDPASCPITADMYYRPSISCLGTTLEYRALAENALVDSVQWIFTGGSPVTSTDEHASAFYTTTGNYPVQLTVYGGGGSAVVNEVVTVSVPDPEANGLEMITSLPFTEGFEGNFSFPTNHLRVEPAPTPSWELYILNGYASDHSVMVPPGDVTVPDTSIITIGNFDLTGLVQPTVQVKVSGTGHVFTRGGSLHLMFRDQCSNIYQGNLWQVWDLMSFADYGTNFAPTNDGQWITLSASIPSWNMAASAEIGLRLVRPWLPPTAYTPEAIYLDDIYVGELPLMTGVIDVSTNSEFSIAPNPSNGEFVLRLPAVPAPNTLLFISDAQGRRVVEERITAMQQAIKVDLPPGLYTVQLSDSMGALRLVVE